MNLVSLLLLSFPSAIMKLQLLWQFSGALIMSPIVTGWWSLSQSLWHMDAESPEGEFRFNCFSCCQHSPFQFVIISPLIKNSLAFWHMPWYCTALCKSLISPLHRMHSLVLSQEVLVDWTFEETSVSLSDECENVLSRTKNKNKKKMGVCTLHPVTVHLQWLCGDQ